MSMHLEDEDVKIWGRSKGGGDGDDDVRIWGGGSASGKRPLAPEDDGDAEESDGGRPRRRRDRGGAGSGYSGSLSARNIALVSLSAVLLIAAMLLPTSGWLRLASFIAPFLLVSVGVLLDAVEKLLAGKLLSPELIMTAAAFLALGVEEYTAAVLIMLLFRVGKMAESFAAARSGRSVDELMEICADTADVETAEGVITVSPDYVNVGDIITVAPGERIALDGVVIDGISSVDLSPLTGVSSPKAVTVGSRAYSGTINLTTPIRIKVTRTYNGSTAMRVVRMTEDSPEVRSKQELFTRSFSKYFTPAVVIAAILLGVLPPLFDGLWTQWLRRSVVFLAVACPDALLVSVPLAFFGGIGSATKQGILVKGSSHLEQLARADTIVFSKTGTITEGRFTITDVFPVGMSEHELLTIAATAESMSNHPIARSLRAACGALDPSVVRVVQIEELPGLGVSAFVGDKQVYVGNAALLEKHGIGCPLPSRSGAAIHVAVDNIYCGHILISDRMKAGAFDAMENLRVLGVKKLVMLTGDVLSVARPIASKLFFDMLRAELLPEEKVAAIDYLIKNRGDYSAVAFVGDGINDSAALEHADVGVAIGALGSDEAVRSADILLMDEDIRKLPLAVKIARASDRAARENIILALAAKLLILTLGAAGLAPAAAAILCDAGVLIATIANSMRTLLIKKKEA